MIQMPDIDADYHDPDAPFEVGEDGAPVGLEPERIDREAFWVVFETAFSVPGMMMEELKPLAIKSDEKTAARAASDATYSLLEIYYPAALMPQSATLAHLMVAGPFFVGKALIVREILRARQAKQMPAPRNAPEPQQRSSAHDPSAFLDAEVQPS